jgi:hypothetical protein
MSEDKRGSPVWPIAAIIIIILSSIFELIFDFSLEKFGYIIFIIIIIIALLEKIYNKKEDKINQQINNFYKSSINREKVYNIDEAADKLNLQYYHLIYNERIGKFPPAKKNTFNHRYYTEDDLKQLQNIANGKTVWNKLTNEFCDK